MEDQPMVLILARSAQLRNSLEVLIAASALVKSIRQEKDFDAIETVSSGQKPDLVILAFEPDGWDMQSVLHQINSLMPETPTIVLIDSEHDFPKALAAGADAVFIKGTRASYLLAAVENLLLEH